jgi:hypothetical protein
VQIGNEHNFVWKRGDSFFHGKGATPAWQDASGRPLLGLIPLNMAREILLVLGSNNNDYLSRGRRRRDSAARLHHGWRSARAALDAQASRKASHPQGGSSRRRRRGQRKLIGRTDGTTLASHWAMGKKIQFNETELIKSMREALEHGRGEAPRHHHSSHQFEGHPRGDRNQRRSVRAACGVQCRQAASGSIAS